MIIYSNRYLKDEIKFKKFKSLVPYREDLWKKIFPKRDLGDEELKKLKLSQVGLYSISHPKHSVEISKIIRSYLPTNSSPTITDATGNTGGNSFSFYDDFVKVNTVEIDDEHCKILENNFAIYNMKDKVNLICDDVIELIKNNSLKQDAIYFDPPWGGVNYKKNILLRLSLGETKMKDLIKLLIEKKSTSVIAMRVPFNFDFKEIFSLVETNISTYVHSFYKDDGRLTFFMIILKIN